MSSDYLSNTFAALADLTRRAILSRLASGEASVTELAEPSLRQLANLLPAKKPENRNSLDSDS